jgi:DNA primase
VAIPQTFIQELLARADVVDIVGRFVPLKKGGANFMGLCPFHGEKSPSFSVSPTKQFYHCFGCGKNGNALGFLMEHGGMSFIEAVQDLAQQYGLQVPEDEASPQDRALAAQQRARQLTLTEVLEKAGDAYRVHLRNTAHAVDYFKRRGVSGEVAKRFGLGYAPEGWRSLASVFAAYDDPLLAESGLVVETTDEETGDIKRYDRFRDRVMFPIRNIKGECIGFGGRVLGEREGISTKDAGPKYLNSPETPVFSKGRELYGLFEARQSLRELGYVLVTEGYMDVVALAQLGFPNAVATLGTACTTEHVQKLFRFTDSVVFSFDGDAAGRRAALKALDGSLPYATDVRSVKFLFLPPEHDPDSYIRAFGQEAFAQFVAEALPLSRFLLDTAAQGCDQASAEGRARLAAQARPLWQAMPDGALKRQLLAEIAQLVQLDGNELMGVWGLSQRAGKPNVSAADLKAGFQSRAEREHYENSSGSSRPGKPHKSKNFKSPYPSAPAAGGHGGPRPRALPTNRADHTARRLLTEAALWEALSPQDQALLCDLPTPHGPLFAWLDAQLQEHGPLPWGALREGLREHVAEALALRVMQPIERTQAPSSDDPIPNEQAVAQGQAAARAEALDELRSLLDLMLDEHLKTQETQALQNKDMALYQRLHEQRRLRAQAKARALQEAQALEKAGR